MDAIIGVYQKRYDDVAATISSEMGAPMALAKNAQAATGCRGIWRLSAKFSPIMNLKRKGRNPHSQRAGGCVRSYHAVELANQPNRLQSRTGLGRRLHNGVEAV